MRWGIEEQVIRLGMRVTSQVQLLVKGVMAALILSAGSVLLFTTNKQEIVLWLVLGTNLFFFVKFRKFELAGGSVFYLSLWGKKRFVHVVSVDPVVFCFPPTYQITFKTEGGGEGWFWFVPSFSLGRESIESLLLSIDSRRSVPLEE